MEPAASVMSPAYDQRRSTSVGPSEAAIVQITAYEGEVKEEIERKEGWRVRVRSHPGLRLMMMKSRLRNFCSDYYLRCRRATLPRTDNAATNHHDPRHDHVQRLPQEETVLFSANRTSCRGRHARSEGPEEDPQEHAFESTSGGYDGRVGRSVRRDCLSEF